MGKSKYANRLDGQNQNQSTNDIGRRNTELERSREKLMTVMLEYKGLLDETILLANRTEPEKNRLSALLSNINDSIVEVDSRSLGEGSRVIGSAMINSLLLLNDKINQLKYHNFYLTQRVEVLEKANEKNMDIEDKKEDLSDGSKG